MLRFAIDAVTGFSIVPLRAASYVGIGVGLVGLFLLMYTFGAWAFGEVVQGWTSMVSIVLSRSSAQLLVLGCIGEYLGRLVLKPA